MTWIFTVSFNRHNVTIGIPLLKQFFHIEPLCGFHYCTNIFPFPKKNWRPKIELRENLENSSLNVRLLKSRVRRIEKELAYERMDWVPYPRQG